MQAKPCSWRIPTAGGSWCLWMKPLSIGKNFQPRSYMKSAARGRMKISFVRKSSSNKDPDPPFRPEVKPSRPLNLLVASSEAIPYAKTGGLADVAGALPREFAKLGHDVILLLPRYREVG